LSLTSEDDTVLKKVLMPNFQAYTGLEVYGSTEGERQETTWPLGEYPVQPGCSLSFPVGETIWFL